MIKIAVIIGSTRPNRNGEAVAKWVYKITRKRSDAEFELVDIKDFNLPLLGEPVPPSLGQYSKPHTKVWAAKIGSFDGYVFVSPEYNHGIAGALKNAIDFLFAEWNNKAQQDSKFEFNTFGLHFDAKVSEYVPHSRVGWFGKGPDVSAYHTWLLAPRDGGCQVITEEVAKGPGAIAFGSQIPTQCTRVMNCG